MTAPQTAALAALEQLVIPATPFYAGSVHSILCSPPVVEMVRGLMKERDDVRQVCAFCGKPLTDSPCITCQYPPGSERGHAVILANKILDRINGDPDDDLAVLSRQLLRTIDRAEAAEASLSALQERVALMQSVVDAACSVVTADTYKHPVLSRQDAVKAGVDGLHDAVGRLQSMQSAAKAAPPASPCSAEEDTQDRPDAKVKHES